MAIPKPPVTLALGVGTLAGDPSKHGTLMEIFDTAREINIRIVDTARHYNEGKSESFLGDSGLSSEFKVITKAPMCLVAGGSSKEGIIKQWEDSEKALKVSRVEYYLLHVPDDDFPIGETMDGIQILYLADKFEKFGLSNFSPRQVEECHAYAQSHGYVLPSVYQGVYSAVSRGVETNLFPTLRRLNISIQAYSALACGFLVKTPDEIRDGKGNFDRATVLGKILHHMYGGPSYLRCLEKFASLAKEAGSTPAGLAYRWVVWNSALDAERGDCVVLGVSSVRQLQDTVENIGRGPLEEWVVKRLDDMWDELRDDAPGDNFSTYKRLMKLGIL